jgi:outer membrane protein assembly factor BamB
MVHDRRILSAILLGLLCSLQTVHSGKLAETVQAARLRNGVILLVNAEPAIYDEAADTGCTVRGLESDSARVATLRKRFLAKGIYGKLSVASFDGKTLPCIDSLANVVLVGKANVTKAEALRVLVPGGSALFRRGAGWETHVKPWPKEMGEWNQYLCGADNNGAAKDSAGPPERLQWTAGSRYGRVKVVMPSVTSMVSDDGRVYTVEDMATTESGRLPKQYVLLARDAFNGCELWRHPLKDWDKEGCRPVKDIPVQLQRLVLAVDGKVYCTDGYDGPIAVFDGATGDTLSTFKDSENTREIAHADGMIFAIQGEPYAFRTGVGKRKGFDALKIATVKLSARNARNGKILWEIPIEGTDGYIGGTLSIKSGKLAYLTRNALVCRNSRTGQETWTQGYPYFQDMPRKGVYILKYNNSPPTLVMTDKWVFCSDLNLVKAYDMANGSLLWRGKTECNYTKNGDLFYADGLVWTGLLKGLDPATGEVKRELQQKMTGPMSHDRCYRNRITQQYYINSKSGGTDLVALDGSGEYPGPWMRATCGLAMTPSFGRLYSSPYVCACEIGSMLLGFNCTYNQSRDQGKLMAAEPASRLIKGPAYGRGPTGAKASATDWPTYRRDNARSGVTTMQVPKQLKVAWRATLPGTPTAPVIADGLLLTAVKGMHTVFALDSRTGDQKWQFTADGPIDSPPTYYQGLALFGSRDGWVYCLNAKTGDLVWKFSDMPDVRYMCAFEQLESAWPVNGSIMIKNDLAYFAAGRSSFLDGGIVAYALNPQTGEVKHRRTMAGPYDDKSFPIVQRGKTHRSQGFRSGIFASKGDNLYIRHQGFKNDLSPISPYDIKTPHLMSSTGFLCDSPQHRTYWTVDTDFSYGPGKGYDGDGPQGDIMVVTGNRYYEVRGYSPGRHTQREDDPLKMYRVIAGHKVPAGRRGRRIPSLGGPSVPHARKWEKWARHWTTQIPIAGHAILAANETLVVAGVPMRPGFAKTDIEASYRGGKGGLLWTLAAKDGKPTGELVLPAPPVWDGLAAAEQRVFLPLKDGTILCLAAADTTTAPPKSLYTKGPTGTEEDGPDLLKPLTGDPIWLYRDDFEEGKVGAPPSPIVGADEGKGSAIVVTDAAAKSGQHSLMLRDAAGLKYPWMPIWETRFPAPKILGGVLTLSFDVMMSREQPGRLNVMLRHYGDYGGRPPFRTVSQIAISPDGTIDVQGKKVAAPRGAWHHVELSFRQGLPGERVVNATITTADGRKHSFKRPFVHPEFVGLSWLGFSAGGNEASTTYVDNVSVKLEKAP